MIKRIIDISEAAYVHLKHKQLLIDKQGETVAQIPIEDLGVVILQHPAIVITQAVIIACQQNNVALLFCDERHLPYSVALPISDGHTLHNKILKVQVNLKKTVQKRLWQQIVKTKIQEQALTLALLDKNTKPIDRLALKVKSDDSENVEAQAAQKYWRLLMGDDFRRDIDQPGINVLLNYGYSIIRAMVARAIVGSGLHPAIGLHHQNQYNGLCLADDLMEPFRPWVDERVYRIVQKSSSPAINAEVKQQLLGLLSETVLWQEQKMPFMVACHYFMACVKTAYEDDAVKLAYPQLLSRQV